MSAPTARVMLTPETTAQAQDVLDGLNEPTRTLSVTAENRDARPLPRELQQLLRTVIEAAAAGRALSVTAIPEVLTTVEAAQMLGVSRPTLMKLVRSGELPSHMTGTHHRIKTTDLVAHMKAEQTKRVAAFNSLRDLLDG